MRRARRLRTLGLTFLMTALLISVLSVQAFAAGDIGTAYLSVAGKSVTEANKDDILGDGGSVRAAYDEDANQVTLTLTNANITYRSVVININANIPLVIELVGENYITASGSRECISYRNNLTIQGSGTLELNSAGSNAIVNSATGDGPSNLVISGVPSLTANGLYLGINIVGGVRIENSTVTVTCTESYNSALQATQNIEISDSSVTATASGSSTYGIQSQSGSIAISGSKVNVNSTVMALMSGSDVTINDSTLELTASQQYNNCVFANGTLTIENGSEVTATSSYPALYGATGLTIADSRVQATATDDIGIWTRGNLSVSGDVDIVSNGIAMADGCTFTVTPAAGSLLEVKAGPSQTDAKHIADSPFAEQVSLSRINDAYCSIKTHQHVGGTATCVAAAICSDCGQSYGTPDAANHVALNAVAEKPATCTEPGNIAYWHCEDCGKYFRDEACTDEITQADTVLAIIPHNTVKTEGKPATCTEPGNITYWHCEDCGKYFRDEACTEEITQADTVLAITPHNAVKTEGKPATCTESGNIAYWYCADCGKYFSDEACTQEIMLADTVLSAKGHQYQDGVCTVCGAKDPNVQPTQTGDKGEGTKPSTTPEQTTASGPKTGDDTLVGVWVFLLLAGMAGLTGMVYYRKKKQ